MKTKLATIREQLIEDIDDFEVEFKNFHKKERRNAERRGRRDGRDEKPAPEATTMNAVEKEIYHSYSTQIAELARDFQGTLTQIKTEYVVPLNRQIKDMDKKQVDKQIIELKEKRDSELRKLEQDYREKIEEIQKDPDLTSLRDKYDEADDNYQDLSELLGRKDTNAFFNWPKWLYAFVIFLIGVFEMAANYGMFLNFEEPPLTTLIWAIGFGIVVSLVAHFNGMLLARGNYLKKYHVMGGAMCVVMLAGVVFLARFRMEALPDDIPGKMLSEPVFIFISVIFYMAALFLSFMSHDSNPEFINAIEQRKKAREKLDAKKKEIYEKTEEQKKNLKQAEKTIAGKYEAEIKAIAGKEDALRYLYQDALALHDDILQGLKNMEGFIIQSYFETLENYRSANTKRRMKPTPEYWEKEPAELPTKFKQIEEIDPDKNNSLWKST